MNCVGCGQVAARLSAKVKVNALLIELMTYKEQRLVLTTDTGVPLYTLASKQARESMQVTRLMKGSIMMMMDNIGHYLSRVS